MNKFCLYILILIALSFVSCEKQNTKPSPLVLGKEYFPLKKEQSVVYKITEINIDKPSNVYDTSIYYLKEIVESSFVDNENGISWRIERYTKKDINSNWVINSVWSAKITDSYASKFEENQRKIKIRFPVKKNLKWNGNLYNELEDKEFEITNLNHKFTINSFSFDSCLTVLQDSNISIIHKNLSYEVYAKNIGLVYKKEININSQEVTYNLPIEQRITIGKIFQQEVFSLK